MPFPPSLHPCSELEITLFMTDNKTEGPFICESLEEVLTRRAAEPGITYLDFR